MRESGILMHITSLPGPYGVGTMGRQAFDFVDFLEQAGQSCWQILPLNPTGYGDSPYQSCSSFAGNHYLIDLDLLVEEGLLRREEVRSISWSQSPKKVDFGRLYRNRMQVLRLAYSRFRDLEALEEFGMKNSNWLADFGLYMALKEKYRGKPWYQWDDALKFRDPDAIWNSRQELKDEVQFFSFVQYEFSKQWNALRDYAHEKHIRLIGDVPIYVPYDSVDVWTNTELFQLDENMDPVEVAGCPPDAFSDDGQLWGNPLYRWDEMKENGYSWWLTRLGAAADHFDVVRLDHFRGFEAYWAVPFGDETARGGRWVKGPGMDFIRTVQENLPKLELIAEDLGFLTQEVFDLRDGAGLPGMKVLGFAFDSQEPSEYLPHNYTPNSVCYTATHDNMTTRQWFETASPEAVAYARAYMNLTDAEGPVWGVIRTAFASVSDLCILPMQDLLELGKEARMNFPGTMTSDNWTWRAEEGAFTPALAQRLLGLTKLYCRYHGKKIKKMRETAI